MAEPPEIIICLVNSHPLLSLNSNNAGLFPLSPVPQPFTTLHSSFFFLYMHACVCVCLYLMGILLKDKESKAGDCLILIYGNSLNN